MARPRICFVDLHHPSRNAGGAEIQMEILGRELAARGWDVHYAALDIDARQQADGITLHPLPDPALGEASLFFAVLAEIGADVYYQRGRKSVTAPLASFCSTAGKPMVFALSMDIDCRRYRQAWRLPPPARWPGFLRGWRRLRRLDRESLAGMRGAHLVLAQGEWQQAALRASLGVESVVMRSVHRPLAGARGWPERAPCVLWLANLKRWKRPERFMELARRCAGEDCRFVLAGRMVDAARYARAVAQWSAGDSRRRYVADVDYAASNELLAGATLFVNTSCALEGFPNTFVQAWQHGVPVISLGVDPDRLMARHGAGMVAGGVGGLAAPVRGLIRDRARAAQLSRNALALAQREFDADMLVNRLETLLRDRLGAGTPSALSKLARAH